MDSFTLLVTLFFIALTLFLSFMRRRRNLPPGPFPLPIIGNMLQIGPKPYQSFAQLSKKYGPLMSIHFGSLYSVVVSSPEMAKEILLKRGLAFSGRTINEAVHACDHHKVSIAFLPAGGRVWRDMRKLCNEQMFSHASMEASEGLRQQKLQQLLDHVQKCSDTGRAVDIREAAFITTLNLMSTTLFSTQATEFDSEATMEFKEIISGVSTIAGVPNFADFFPFLKPFDLQGIKRSANVYFGKFLVKIEGYMTERLESRRTNPNSPKNDFLETLVDIMDTREYQLTADHVKHLLLAMFTGGVETNTTSIEWIMSELVANPDKMAKAKAELQSVAGEKKLLEERDIARLPYLRAVVKETMRLHLPNPLLFPRKAESDEEVGGYLIPKGTQILVNAWALSKDPSIWMNPNSFEPERFLDEKIDFKGLDFEFIPFGAGRRMCPGVPLADRIMHMATAALVHNFDWKLGQGTVDKDKGGELFGLTLKREVPLSVIPIKPVSC